MDAELWFGLEKIKAPAQARTKLASFLNQFERVTFDFTCALHYARARAALEPRGSPSGPNGLLIASVALAAGAVLVTEVLRVPGLAVEDWTVASA